MSVQSIISANVKAALTGSEKKTKKPARKRSRIAALVASSIVESVTKAEDAESKELQTSGIETMEPDKQAYYLGLAVREVQSLVEMANFNLGNALTQGKAAVTNMFFERNGTASVDVHIPFETEVRDDYSEMSGAFSLELRKEYKDLVTYNVTLPTATKPSVSVDITLTIPAALLASIGADQYDSRTKVLQKYIEGLLKKSLA